MNIKNSCFNIVKKIKMMFDNSMHVYNSYKRIVNTCAVLILLTYSCVAYNHLDSFKKEHFNSIFHDTELVILANQHPQLYDDFDRLLNLDPTLNIEEQREIFIRHLLFQKTYTREIHQTCESFHMPCRLFTPTNVESIEDITTYKYQYVIINI